MFKGTVHKNLLYLLCPQEKQTEQNTVIALRALTCTSLQSTMCLQISRKRKMPCGEKFGESLQMVDSPTMKLMCSQLCVLCMVYSSTDQEGRLLMV